MRSVYKVGGTKDERECVAGLRYLDATRAGWSLKSNRGRVR